MQLYYLTKRFKSYWCYNGDLEVPVKQVLVLLVCDLLFIDILIKRIAFGSDVWQTNVFVTYTYIYIYIHTHARTQQAFCY